MRSLDIVLEIGGITMSDADKKDLATRKNEWFVEYVEQMQPDEIFPGVKELITNLKKNNIKVALASSSKNAARVIERLQIENLFEAMVDGTMVARSKPDPEIFLSAAARLGEAPAHCLVFEDAEAGVAAAHAAGMKCVGVGDAEILAQADLVVQRTGDFRMETLRQLETA